MGICGTTTLVFCRLIPRCGWQLLPFLWKIDDSSVHQQMLLIYEHLWKNLHLIFEASDDFAEKPWQGLSEKNNLPRSELRQELKTEILEVQGPPRAKRFRSWTSDTQSMGVSTQLLCWCSKYTHWAMCLQNWSFHVSLQVKIEGFKGLQKQVASMFFLFLQAGGGHLISMFWTDASELDIRSKQFMLIEI